MTDLSDEGRIQIKVVGSIARIVIDNPTKRNALSASMWQALRAAARELAGRLGVRAVAITSTGELAFSAGADIDEFADSRSGGSDSSYDDLVESACRAVESLPQTTLAIVRGVCAGAGNSIAASCDLRIASDDAYFAHPAVKLGLGYDARGIARFVRAYGTAPTRLLLLAGERLPAARAFAIGIVDELHSPFALDSAASDALQRVSRHAPLSVAAAKATLRVLTIQPDRELLEQAIDLARRADRSADYEEGRRAFRERREPRFEGR